MQCDAGVVRRETKGDSTQVTAEELDKNNHEYQVFRGISPCPLVVTYQKTWIFETEGNSNTAVKKRVHFIMKSRHFPRNHFKYSNTAATCARGASEEFLNDLKFLQFHLAYHNFNYI